MCMYLCIICVCIYEYMYVFMYVCVCVCVFKFLWRVFTLYGLGACQTKFKIGTII